MKFLTVFNVIAILAPAVFTAPAADTRELGTANSQAQPKVMYMTRDEIAARSAQCSVSGADGPISFDNSTAPVRATRVSGFEPDASSPPCAAGCYVAVRFFADSNCCTPLGYQYVGDGGTYCYYTPEDQPIRCVVLERDVSCNDAGFNNRVALYLGEDCEDRYFTSIWSWETGISVTNDLTNPWKSWNLLCHQ